MMRVNVNIDEDKVRQLCISRNWFTKGNNQQYSDMFGYIRKYNKTQDVKSLVNAALLIINHSENMEDYETQTMCDSILYNCSTAYITED